MKTGEVLQVGDLSFNTSIYAVVRQGQNISLNPTHYRLLEVLMKVSPNVIKKENIEDLVWGKDILESEVLKTTIHMLRKKIDLPFEYQMIKTIRGIGYYIK